MNKGIVRLVLGSALALLAGRQVAADPFACCFGGAVDNLNACKTVGCKGLCNFSCIYNHASGSCTITADCCSCTSW
jgi:hypothetical protein